ncbi:WXG100 family type VII secretion target [Microbacterium sp. zg.Y625]|uniref:WXG100 family type VII secretion target n=1 Tax=Microbacterium TaxID=33882 RepID=UPI00214BC37D|nr:MULTISPECIES: WXG100 family type VII secretion target [unclassified Microbacterium]MCR2791730.1 WXG100 family type VII secretion target [Microbacterium sp. zg.Y625]MCR2799523.1 WXG100 family type VII secretion target [Microbacterium sp. zg.Y818]MCR2816557.1 WXG100 family type VII secretion target [Microbacterium sp. zg.Y843]MCR2826862.1 WXG100 family type VII secretion target [Microbacterium sp. zg.Y909]WIM21518.1 WXG100 family type VII secretion target [Microbacterium sp. zg-Y818]
MAVFSVDSDAVLTATAAVRGTADRLAGETSAMLAQLTALQSSWTGSAALGFQSVIDRWRATQREVETSLADISAALATAGQQYAQTEAATAGLFR